MIDVPAPHAWAEAEALDRQSRLTKPAGSLGRLEELSVWLAACQGACPPRPPQRVRVVVFAGDHGIAAAGVSAYPAEVTAQMVATVESGGAVIAVLARLLGASVRIVDMAVGRPSGRIDVADALTASAAQQAFDRGRRIIDEEVDAGADLLVPGDLGIANTTASAVLVGALTRTEPVRVTGRGTGIDDATWMRKVAAVRDGLRRCRGLAEDPMGLLATAGGADLAALTGFLVQAAVRRTPVILDGVVSATCALLADRLAPGARQWYAAGSRSSEPAQRLALEALGLEPLLDLGLRLGEGSGGLLAVPLVQAAAAVLAETATFEEAGVSERG